MGRAARADAAYELLGRDRSRDEFYLDAGDDSAPHVDEHIIEGLREIRPGGPPGPLHLRFNLRGAKYITGRDVSGREIFRYEPRWELWDIDAHGGRYLFMVIQDDESKFQEPGEWLVQTLRRVKHLHEDYDGDAGRIIQNTVILANEAADNLDDKAFNDMVFHAAKEWWRDETPKSSASQQFRGQRALST